MTNKALDFICPRCGTHWTEAQPDKDGKAICYHCNWKEGDPMPIPSDTDNSRIERLVVALIGTINLPPFTFDFEPKFAHRIVSLAVQLNEEIKKAETGPALGDLPAKPFIADTVEWPTDE